ncbi:MAG: right-handed parallel beta-helix repeat-containing protein [Candidatus Eisenbacteria bacterium]
MRRLLLLAITSALLIAHPAFAETWVVDARGGDDVFRYIDQGLAWASEGDTVLIRPGVYAGFRNKDLDLAGLNVVIHSTAGPESTIIDCENSGRAFHIHQGVGPSCVIAGLTIRNGSNRKGGGMLIEGSAPTLVDLVFEGNTSTRSQSGYGGGAIFCTSASAPTIRKCVFLYNKAYRGGGACFDEGSDATVESCTFVRNWGHYVSNGIHCDNSSPTIERTVVAFGAAGNAMSCWDGSSPTVSNSLLYGNPNGDDACGSTGGILAEDPLFCDLEAGDVRICEDSPCLPENNPFGVLLGARDEGGCDCPPTTGRVLHVPSEYATVEDALASAAPGDTVLLAPGTYNESELHVPWSVALVGRAGPDSTVIDGSGYGSGTTGLLIGYGAERVDGLPPARLEGLTVTGFNDSGIMVRSCAPVITDCVVRDNTTWYRGGGLRCEQRGSPLVTDVWFIRNSVPDDYSESYGGGAVGCQELAAPVLERVVFWENYAAYGGAVWCGTDSSPVVKNCTIAGTMTHHGAIHLRNGSSLTLEESIVAFTEGGGAFYPLDGDDGAVSHCVVFANSGGDSLPGAHSENIFEDPRFCSLSEGKLTPLSDSPCLPENNDHGVLIGALPYEDCTSPQCRVLRVPGEYATIASALDAAAYCDTVLVSPGVYEEWNLEVPWGVALRAVSGPDSTTVDAGLNYTAVRVGYQDGPVRSAGATVIEGFTITRGDPSGIRLKNSAAVVRDCVVESNRASYGGGIHVDGGSPLIVDCVVRGNRAFSYSAGSGGGFYGKGDGTTTIRNTVFDGNSTVYGGAVYCDAAHGVIAENCTIVGNEAEWGGGTCAKGEASLERCIVAFCGPGEAVRCEAGSSVAVSFSCFFASGWSDSLCGEHSANVFADPGFCDREGGDLRLCADSPCLPENNPHGVLIGALEAGGCDCPGPPECRVLHVPGEYATIGEALEQAARCDTVLVQPGTYLERDLYLPWDVSLVGAAGPDSTVLDAGGEGTILFMGSSGRSGTGGRMTLVEGFTFAGAYESAIQLVNGDPRVANCVFSGNEGYHGGGLYCLGASPTLRDVVFSDNHARQRGGAMYFDGRSDATLTRVSARGNDAAYSGGAAYCRNSSPIMSDCEFTENDAKYGGALYCYGDSSPTIEGSLFSGNGPGNWSGGRGGGVCCGGGATPTFSRVTFVGNWCWVGGAIHCDDSSPQITGCTFAGNYVAGTGANYGACIGAWDESYPTVEYSVVSFCASGTEYYSLDGGYVTTSHSVVFGNADGDSLGGVHYNNIFLDPLFCDRVGGDFTVDTESPCVPGNNPWGELVGAWGAGCSETDIDEPNESIPVTALGVSCAPNPFRHAVVVALELPDPAARATVEVFSLNGRLVRSLLSGSSEAGRRAVSWNGRDESGRQVASGVYFARLTTEYGSASSKLVLLR